MEKISRALQAEREVFKQKLKVYEEQQNQQTIKQEEQNSEQSQTEESEPVIKSE